MVKIQCINPQFIQSPHIFEWDETPYGKIVQPDEPGAKRIIAYCKLCAYENPVWVKNITLNQRGHVIYRGDKKDEQ